MKIGIDASRAFLTQRTGIEEYSYQVIRHLRKELQENEVFLYVRKNQKADFDLPTNWKIKTIKFPRLWTQIGLSLEMLFNPVDTLFIPAHVVPIIHPKNTIVTIHGLEFEIFPKGYSFWAQLYMHWSIKFSCKWAKKIIAVSQNTKKDLMKLYKVPEDKIEVVHEGVNQSEFMRDSESADLVIKDNKIGPKIITPYQGYFLFIGRLEKRKNIIGIIEAFEILREKYGSGFKLVLAGKFGYGEEEIKNKIENSKHKNNIEVTGYISEEKKWELLRRADVFLFPTFYEGFGLPILEAQNIGTLVVTSSIRPHMEIAGEGAIFCDPKNPESIAEAVYSLISSQELRNDIIKKGYENIKRFSWEDCSFRVSKILTDGNK